MWLIVKPAIAASLFLRENNDMSIVNGELLTIHYSPFTYHKLDFELGDFCSIFALQ